MSVGSKLSELMEARQTNANQLSQLTGVSVNTIYSIVRRDNTKVDLSVLQALSSALGVTLDYFADAPHPQPYLNPHEQALLESYRASDMRLAVDKLLGIE